MELGQKSTRNNIGKCLILTSNFLFKKIERDMFLKQNWMSKSSTYRYYFVLIIDTISQKFFFSKIMNRSE